MGPCGPQGTIRTRMDTYGHQMLPRALLEMNVLKMPHQMLPRCLPDASKSFPDASSDASQMPPRALLEMNAQGRTKIYITPHMTHKCKAKKFLGPRCNRTVVFQDFWGIRDFKNGISGHKTTNRLKKCFRRKSQTYFAVSLVGASFCASRYGAL